MIPDEVFAESLLEFLAPVRAYLQDPSVSEVMINGPKQVYVERRGRIEATQVEFKSREAVLKAVRNAAQFAGKCVDALHPILEARLPDGSRFQAVVPPAAPEGPYVAIRRFTRDVLALERLIELGSLSKLAADSLRALVNAKLNILVGGGTGSGKTSLLSALASCSSESERLVVIEDSRELDIRREHVLSLEARQGDPTGKGRVTIRDLFRATLRLRPDRIVIGEIRGGEALDIVQAMVSGHGGCMGTLHATYPRDTLTRLETMAMMSDVQIPLAALRLQIASGINIIVQADRAQDGRRHVTHISEVQGFDAGECKYRLQDLFVREYDSVDSESRVNSRLVPTDACPRFLPQLERHGQTWPPELGKHPETAEATGGRGNPAGGVACRSNAPVYSTPRPLPTGHVDTLGSVVPRRRLTANGETNDPQSA